MPIKFSDRRSFVTRTLALAVTSPAMLTSRAEQPAENAAKAPQGKLMAYVGTFSSPLKDMLPTQVDLPPGNGRGIHLFSVDSASGELTPEGTFDLGTSPSCLVINEDGTRLYSANETDRVGAEKVGTVSAFSIARDTGQLTLINTVPSGGAGPTYVSLHPQGKYLLVANYFGGSVAVLPIEDGGGLGEASDLQIDQGELGSTRAIHAAPGSFAISGHDRTHAHMIAADASGQWVLHVDLGLDKIFVWQFDAQHGKLQPAETPFVKLPDGDGPRHFDFHPSGRWLYSIQEEGSTVVGWAFDSATGRLREMQTLATLPEGFQGSNFCSAILVSGDGRFLYAGNRLHDSIALFSIDAEGQLSYLGEEWTRGNYPRSFSFDPSGNFLYCCNQRSDHVAVFRVDREQGSLEFTGHYAAVGNPSMMAFCQLPSAQRR